MREEGGSRYRDRRSPRPGSVGVSTLKYSESVSMDEEGEGVDRPILYSLNTDARTPT